MDYRATQQLARLIYESGLMTPEQIDDCLNRAGGLGKPNLVDFIRVLLTGKYFRLATLMPLLMKIPLLTSWQLSRILEGHPRGYFYGDWKILQLIGAGTYWRVYRAEHRESGSVKAVKVLRTRYSRDDNLQTALLQEARSRTRLCHPNIAAIHEANTQNGTLYLITDAIEGQNLRDYIKAHKKLSISKALKITKDIVLGLENAASHGIFHGNLKPSNVLISAKGDAILVDLGLITLLGERGANDDAPRSLDYAGLEACCHSVRNDPRSDLFFVGCMIYQMLSGVPPLTESRERTECLATKRFTSITPIVFLEPDLPSPLVQLIGNLMELDPKNRIQTPAEIRQEIDFLLANGSITVEPMDPDDTRTELRPLINPSIDSLEGIGKTILLVEPNQKLRHQLIDRLEQLGYQVNAADLEEDFLPRVGKKINAIDCVIFGCLESGRDGIEAFERFAVQDPTCQIPAILILPENLKRSVHPDFLDDHRVKVMRPVKFGEIRRFLKKAL